MGPKTKHETRLRFKHPLYTYSKDSYVYLLILCMKQCLGAEFSFCSVLTVKKVCVFKDLWFQIFICRTTMFKLVFSWSSEVGLLLGGDCMPGT